MPSGDGAFVLEDRDTEKKLASFTCLDQRTGTPIWKDIEFDEKWWMSIKMIYRGVLFLHGYASPDMPEEKKIFAVDLRTGALRWSNDEMKFLFVRDASVYASREGITDRRFYELELNTGEMKREIDEDALDALRNDAAGDAGEVLRFPNVYHGDTEGAPLKDAVNRATQKANTVALTEYLEEGNFVVVGWYENTGTNPMQQALRHRIIVLNREHRKVLFTDIVTEDAVVPVPETFFGLRSFIYYIKNKRTLTALDLSAN